MGCPPGCYRHDHTERERQAKINRDIKTYGWSVIGILDEPSYAYTVGLTARRWPELHFVLDAAGTQENLVRAQKLINAVGNKLVEARNTPQHGDVIVISDSDGNDWKCLLERKLNTSPLKLARAKFRVISALDIDIID